jgi:5-methylcytosine-specific restriction endonuclease McrA
VARIRSLKPGEDLPRYHPLRRLVWERDGGRCGYCGVELLNPPFEGAAFEYPDRWLYLRLASLADKRRCAAIDHITPLHEGGANELDNLVLACRACNGSKGARTILGWLCRLRAA